MQVNIIECPRDAMQGLVHFIPTKRKIAYLNALLKVGFPILDALSFVSPKAVPQMADSQDVVKALPTTHSSQLLAIVVNDKGCDIWLQYPQVHYAGFPLSLSPTFEKRNTQRTQKAAWQALLRLQNKALKHNKKVVVYLSMAFGNPYGDAYTPTLVTQAIQKLQNEGIKHISLADTLGLATTTQIQTCFKQSLRIAPEINLSLHLHARHQDVINKTKAAVHAGCQNIEGTIGGIGGCPFANDKLVGNMDTELILKALKTQGCKTNINTKALLKLKQ